MKSTKQQILTTVIAGLAVTLLSSCGTKKSNVTPQSSSVVISSQQALANCNRFADSSMSYNVAVVKDANNEINSNWIKVKFNFLSSDLTQSGYLIRFYKWRIIGTSAQLDQNPMQFSAYSISNGQTASDTMTSTYSSQITSQYGFYVNLNDDAQYPYQVLKVVAYKSDGTVAAQSDVLIPQFMANPNDYKLNSDGSARAENLTKLHPLNSTDVSQWTQAQLQQNFDQYCF